MKIKSLIKSKKGQMAIVNIILYVIVIFVAAILTPAINGVIIDAINNTANLSSTAITIMNMIIPIFWLGIITIFFIAVVPRPIRE